jgi:hypothetical protein
MATNAITFAGFVLTFNSITVGEVISSSGSRARNIHEVLSTDSTNNAVEKLAGALNEGERTFRIVYDGSTAGVYGNLNTDYEAATVATLLLTYSDTSSISAATAFISNLGDPEAAAADGTLEVDVTFAISGKITFTDVV